MAKRLTDADRETANKLCIFDFFHRQRQLKKQFGVSDRTALAIMKEALDTMIKSIVD